MGTKGTSGVEQFIGASCSASDDFSKGNKTSQPHVLAVDDSVTDRRLIEKLLKISSFKVTTVDSGTRALEFLGLGDESNTLQINKLKVDMIITDYSMPGMTGYELLRRIKESPNLKKIPVVIMSSENVPSRMSRCVGEGAEDFILKPVQLSYVKQFKNYRRSVK